MRKWLIVYTDGSTFSSDDGPYWEAPVGGVQVVYNSDEATGFRNEQSPHGYWGWREDFGGWIGFRTLSGYWDYMFQTGQTKYVLFGRVLDDKDWQEIRTLAGEKATGLKKQGWWPSERDTRLVHEP